MNKNKRVLVTGADGFIGSHLTELLLSEGHEVRALVQYNSLGSWGWLDAAAESDALEVVSGDVRDAHFCRALTQGIDVIYHLAALIAIPYSYVAPSSYLDTNANGTLNLCQAALDNQVGRFIHTSTSEVYGTARHVPIDEAHPLQAQSPYSASKIAADAMAMSYHCAFELPLSIARPFNTYGPRQSARAVIPAIICQIAAGKPEIQLGDLSPTRDFNYVDDTCRGFLALARCPEAIGEVVNIGSNTEISIEDTLHLIRELMNSDTVFVTDEQRLRPAASEVTRLVCDNSKMIEMTGHRPQVDIREGLQRTIDWLCEPQNLQRYRAELYNV
ncbi:NAD-dependent 4,6-dehydratase LegB [Granulosicoccus sp. 3-233]|uniref:NAD-dependent 4,6-dehydratase LegB n=1 Tax=Granulosicoccus sp. 3-233 TaxID=3417969 RepID=UPI003D346D2E